MAFGDPKQHPHKHAGWQAAVKSGRTPAHLKPHFQKRLDQQGMKPMMQPNSAVTLNSGRGGGQMMDQTETPVPRQKKARVRKRLPKAGFWGRS